MEKKSIINGRNNKLAVNRLEEKGGDIREGRQCDSRIVTESARSGSFR
jgi:hypothetical protein